MGKKVYISGFGSSVLESENSIIPVYKENRKLLRFARTSGRLFINSLSDAIRMSNCNPPELDDHYRRGVFFGDFMNLTTDTRHKDELLDHCRRTSGCFDEKIFLHYIMNNWSAVEVLKEVPNIPCFLAAQLTETNGPSETLLNSCASGLSALKSGYELIQSGEIDIAYVGAGSAKADDLERNIFNSQNFFIGEDYKIINAGVAVILESDERLKLRNGKALAQINSAEDAFSPDMFLNQKFDVLSFNQLINGLNIFPGEKTEYILGSFSKRYISEEIEAIRKILPLTFISSGIKESVGYSFSSSGLLEITESLRKGLSVDNLVVTSLGYGGYQSAVYISAV